MGGDLPALCAIEEYSSDRMERTRSQKSPSMHVRGAELIAARELEIRIGGRAGHVYKLERVKSCTVKYHLPVSTT